MITCTFEDGGKGLLRHVVAHGIVEKWGKLLLVKRALRLSEGGKWSLPSGFFSRNETIQECIVREVYEETGWVGKVERIFRVNTKPDRPREDRQNVSFDILVSVSEQKGIPDDESSEIAWFPLNRLPPLASLAFDHGESIGLYLSYKKKTFPLPIIE
jgi:ADP-ribose pyrophosphatase YjhB (NUDIX family)